MLISRAEIKAGSLTLHSPLHWFSTVVTNYHAISSFKQHTLSQVPWAGVLTWHNCVSQGAGPQAVSSSGGSTGEESASELHQFAAGFISCGCGIEDPKCLLGVGWSLASVLEAANNSQHLCFSS